MWELTQDVLSDLDEKSVDWEYHTKFKHFRNINKQIVATVGAMILGDQDDTILYAFAVVSGKDRHRASRKIGRAIVLNRLSQYVKCLVDSNCEFIDRPSADGSQTFYLNWGIYESEDRRISGTGFYVLDRIVTIGFPMIRQTGLFKGSKEEWREKIQSMHIALGRIVGYN